MTASGPVELILEADGLRDTDKTQQDDLSRQCSLITTTGIRRLVWTYEPGVEPLIRQVQRQTGIAVIPVLPNMAAYVRDTIEMGVVGAALLRFRRLSFGARFRLAITNATNAFRVLRREFNTGALILLETELGRVLPLRPREIMLHPTLTDFALALDNHRLFEQFTDLCQNRYGVRPWLKTHNVGLLLPALSRWGIEGATVVAPFNPKGYWMHPSKDACEEAARGTTIQLVATEVDADGTIPLAEGLAYIQTLGLRAAIVSRPEPLQDRTP